ncbi:MAG TPA: LTA synthase family protein [Cytophagaceae bacterium]|jgi:phosphoglycerol transferase MdoB-like AlkP superfamily enzyme|nr:LTA synthase family protein [Cytophagaceae bacterium]
MKNNIRQLLFLAVFWILLFAVYRISFYLCNAHLLGDISTELILQSFYKGFRLDLSMTGYLLALPFLLLLFHYFLQKKALVTTINYLNYFFIILYTLTAVGEFCLYREWKSKLSVQALQHLANPSEVIKTTSIGLTILFCTLSIFFGSLFCWLYRWKVRFDSYLLVPVQSFKKKLWKGVLFLLIGAFVIVVAIRGGLLSIPIQSSDPYFSNQPMVNDVAVNPLWNIMFNLFEYEKYFKRNPFDDFAQADAEKIVSNFYKVKKDTTLLFLTNKRPNIIFILLEGWSAQCIKSYGGDNFAPFFDSLSREGIRYTKFYPPAYTSDQGIPAVLSGYPSASRISIISQSSKSMKLACINKDLKPYGYNSSFIFGGDLNYGNIRSYLFNESFDVIKEEETINTSIPRGKLGIQDEFMAKEFLNLNNATREPFINVWFTLSTHMPYDYKGEKKILTDKENEYVNSISYSDKALKQFFSDAKKQSWYKNTLFVLVSDHSHSSQKTFAIYDAQYHRIPLLFFGDVIDSTFRGQEIDKVFSQIDISYTLLKQMGLDKEAKHYIWSKNMFNPYSKNFSYYCSFNGGGMVFNNGSVGYQHGLKKLVIDSTHHNRSLRDSLERFGKAFQQVFFEDYRLK